MLAIGFAALMLAVVGATAAELLRPFDDPAMMPSAEEVAASRAAFDERARGRAATWGAKLRAASAQADARRRAQEEDGGHHASIFKYDSQALSGGTDISWGSAMTEPAAVGCTDEAAENAGAAQLCQYSCATLKARFLPDAPLAKTRCFLYDHGSGTWPESTAGPSAGGGAAAAEMTELLSMRQHTQDWHTCENLMLNGCPPWHAPPHNLPRVSPLLHRRRGACASRCVCGR
jgi:hypothetical protein